MGFLANMMAGWRLKSLTAILQTATNLQNDRPSFQRRLAEAERMLMKISNARHLLTGRLRGWETAYGWAHRAHEIASEAEWDDDARLALHVRAVIATFI